MDLNMYFLATDFGNNIKDYVSSNIEPVFYAAIIIFGIWYLMQRKTTALIGLIVSICIGAIFIFDPVYVKDFGVDMVKTISGS